MPAESWADLLSNAGDAAQSFELLPVGDYDTVVTKAEVATAKSSGNKMFKLTLKVESGPYANRLLWKDLVVSDGGIKMFFKQMAALTLDGKYFSTEPQDETVLANLIGKRASAKVILDHYNPESPKNKVDFLNPPKGPAPVGGAPATSGPATGSVAGAPPMSPPPVATPVSTAPPVGLPPISAPPVSTDPWAGSTPPAMPGLGEEKDPF